MSIKFYKLHCEICNWGKVTNGAEVEEKLYEYKTSPIPVGIPQFDKENNKVVVREPQKQPRKFRCPKCGRVVIPRQIQDPQEQIDSKNEISSRKRHEQDWADGRKERTQGREI
jgi:hypothetical protein